MRQLKIFGATLLTFSLLDGLWLGWVAPDFYQAQIGFVMADQPNWLAAVIFYFLFIALLIYFAVLPKLSLPAKHVLLSGALFGLATYGTYELTNKATLANWPWTIVLVDIAWGICLCSLSAWAGWYIAQRR